MGGQRLRRGPFSSAIGVPAGNGQSLVEFVLLIPIMLAFLGATIDVARIFHASITLAGATRDAAEYAASTTATEDEALAAARRIVCAQAVHLPGYVPGGTPETCSQPSVTIVGFSRSTTGVGASADYPVATVRVRTHLPFTTLFAYPLVTQNGSWSAGSTQSYSLIQNR